VKRKLGDEAFAAQYEMRARPKQGTLVRQAWVERYYMDAPEALKAIAEEVVIVIDSAVKGAASNDPVSMACWALVHNRKYLIDLVNERMGWLALKNRTRSFLKQHPEARIKLIEDKASGSQLAEELKEEGVSGVVLFNPGVKDKLTRFKRRVTCCSPHPSASPGCAATSRASWPCALAVATTTTRTPPRWSCTGGAVVGTPRPSPASRASPSSARGT
jgi:predicted phage terminase large subunit-like protein